MEYNYCHIVGKTDVGKKRKANEDSMGDAVTRNGWVSVVCDGMGGHVGGAVASKIAVTTILENLDRVYYEDPKIAIGESIDKANLAILEKAVEQPELAGMGSTCVLLLVRDGKVYIGHVGDSRIYLIRSKQILQLTKDHSYVQMLVDCGEITKEQMERHPRKNEITNALGLPNMSPATVLNNEIIPEAGDCFLLCSDGLSGMVSDNAINKVISRQSEMNAQDRVDKLVAMANENGGLDNITVQLVEFSITPGETVQACKPAKWIWIGVTCVIALLLLGMGGHYWLKKGNDKGNLVCDTVFRDLGMVKFGNNERLVKLVFSDSSLKLERGETTIYTEVDSTLDRKSLVVETPHIKAEFENSLLSFTDKSPGDSVVFSISSSDKTKVYRYRFGIEGAEKDDLLKISQGVGKNAEESKKRRIDNADSSPAKPKIEKDTVEVVLEYDELAKGDRLVFNYSAKASLVLKNTTRSIDRFFSTLVVADLSYKTLYWDMKRNNNQLVFTYKGEKSGDRYEFVIPCVIRDSENQTCVYVVLKKKPAESLENEDSEQEDKPEPGNEPERDKGADEPEEPVELEKVYM